MYTRARKVRMRTKSHTQTERERERERNNKQVVRVSGNGIVETRVVVRNPGQYNQLCCRAPIGWEWDIVVTVSFWATGLNRSPYRDLVSWVLRDQKGAFCLLQFWASHSLSLPPPPHGADGASIFFTFTFTFTVTAFIVQLFHIFTDVTLLLTDINTEMMSSQKEKKKKNIYVSPCVTLSCSIWLYWMTGLKLYSIYIYVLRIVGVYFSLSFLYSIYLTFYKKINVVRTDS